MKAKLYLIPTPLGEASHNSVPKYVLDIIHQLDCFICERGKTARRFLKDWQCPIPLQEMQFLELNKRTRPEELPGLLAPALEEGRSIGLMSEAGCPGVADPGAQLVRLAHQHGLEVVPLVGPSSILLALMASGLNGQSFAFHGYLPIKNPARKKRIQQLESHAQREKQTQLFIETPYRNNDLLKDLLKYLSPATLLSIACELTLDTEYVKTRTISEWNRTSLPDLHKRPTVFLFLP